MLYLILYYFSKGFSLRTNIIIAYQGGGQQTHYLTQKAIVTMVKLAVETITKSTENYSSVGNPLYHFKIIKALDTHRMD